MIRVKCECCDGTGKRALTEVEQETLAAFTDTEWTDTRDMLARLFRGKRTKLTKLLGRLHRLVAIGVAQTQHQPGHRGIRQWRIHPGTPMPNSLCEEHPETCDGTDETCCCADKHRSAA